MDYLVIDNDVWYVEEWCCGREFGFLKNGGWRIFDLLWEWDLICCRLFLWLDEELSILLMGNFS